MDQDDLMAVSRRLDELVREYGAKRTAEEARIVFGSWRTGIDRMEEIRRQVLAEHSVSD